MKKVVVIGAGLAGSEAAWQAAVRGCRVELHEMRPRVQTPAHKTGAFAELVCSNSLRAAGMENAAGLLKEEMRTLGSIIMEAADATAVPAGGALAVDRVGFSSYVTKKLKEHPLIDIIEEEVERIPTSDDVVTIVATGPLTSGSIAEDITERTGSEDLHFFDAAAPVVEASSIDMSKAFRASRYGKGEAAYINCPMNEDEYDAFWTELVNAETAEVHGFEKKMVFEGCMPVEVMASRGKDTLLYGPLKPVGLEDPRTGSRPYAVVQLRQDNAAATLYNIVGFQTHLKWPEQKRVFRMIPGLENASFVRYGVMHRNTFMNSPKYMTASLELKGEHGLFFAGQMTGVEGYIESAASGIVAGINAAREAAGRNTVVFPPETAHGALCHYITSAEGKHFQPMNINFGIMPPLGERIRDKKEKKRRISERALESLRVFAREEL